MIEDAAAILRKSLQSKGLDSKARMSLLTVRVMDWFKVNLPDTSDCIAVIKIETDQLILSGTHSIVLQEVQNIQPELLEFIHSLNLLPIESIQIRRK